MIGLIKDVDSIAVRILMELNVNPQKMYNEINKVLNEYDEETGLGQNGNSNAKSMNNTSFNKTQTLNQFGDDLTKKALEGKLYLIQVIGTGFLCGEPLYKSAETQFLFLCHNSITS